MQYQVPQFTDVEDKIFGPLTLKQFVYVAGSGGLAFLLWRSLPFLIAAPLMLAAVGFGAALAFIQVNKKPLITVIEAAFMYFIRGKLYLWNAERKKKHAGNKKNDELGTQAPQDIPSLSENKLTDLAWSLDINERLHVDRQHEVQ